jgi:hypothetical protein
VPCCSGLGRIVDGCVLVELDYCKVGLVEGTKAVERDYYMELDSCRVCAGLVDMVFITCRRMLQSEFRFNFMILVRSNVRANVLV